MLVFYTLMSYSTSLLPFILCLLFIYSVEQYLAYCSYIIMIYSILLDCRLVGQVSTLCASSCPRDCLSPGNSDCVQVCDQCTCEPPTIADYITGKCVQPEQCTGKLYQLVYCYS